MSSNDAVVFDFPERKDYGIAGRSTEIKVNHFRVKFDDEQDIYHYDLAVCAHGSSGDDLKLAKNLRKAVVKAFLSTTHDEFEGITVVSDQMKNIYTPKKLVFASHTFEGIFPLDVDENRKKIEKSFIVTIKESNPLKISVNQLRKWFNNEITSTPFETIQALDVALRHTASQRFVPVGRNFFNGSRAQPIGNGCELWYGVHQSLRPLQCGLTLNVDTAATSFLKGGPMVDYIKDVLQCRDLPRSFDARQKRDLERALRGVKITVTHRDTKRIFRINKLSPTSAEDMVFADQDGNKQSVADYFEKTYKKPLRYPNLVCIHVGALNGNNYLPLEVCSVVENQKSPFKLSDQQVAATIKKTCTRPGDRMQKITGNVRDSKFATDSIARDFGLQVDDALMTVKARVLNGPDLMYGNGPITPDNGQWNLRGKKFHTPKSVESWAVINFDERMRTKDVDNFLHAMISQASVVGMKLPSKLPAYTRPKKGEDVATTYAYVVRKTNAKFILCVLPNAGVALYGDIKVASDAYSGVVSQCMLSKHIQKKNPQYIGNLFLKINVKLGGKNCVLKETVPVLENNETIIFGADITHPSPLDRNQPSVAAMSASMDKYGATHVASIRQQGHRVEHIEHLESMTVELLKRYYDANGTKPKRIIFYRDGVSEGQFKHVLDHEIHALKKAFATLDKDYSPTLTFVIVQKRHHTRFFPLDQRDKDRSQNCKAGTIVEKDICHPREFDFYLQSHAGLQGTSRPTHYHVLLDENQFTSDSFQQLTFYLCHLYVRCPKSVSLVPAVYYAHLIAFRARFYLGKGKGGKRDAAGDTYMAEFHENLKDVMFFA
jgi:eukaryotic translation initiation factor 2C